MYEAHDLLHILPSEKSPEECNGSLLSSAYLDEPVSRRVLGRRKTRRDKDAVALKAVG